LSLASAFQEVDLKAPPEGGGFDPGIQTINDNFITKDEVTYTFGFIKYCFLAFVVISNIIF